jgi:signal transduction histidine kinase
VTNARIEPVETAAARGHAGRIRIANVPSRLGAAFLGSGLVVGLAAIIVFDRSWRPEDLLPVLVGCAGLIAALLARAMAPGFAWMALIVGSLAAAGVPTGLSRAADPGVIGVGPWLVLAIPASISAIVTVAITALYATRPERRLTRVGTLAAFLVAWLAVACAVVVVLTIAGARADPDFTIVDVTTTPTGLFLHFVLLLAALGVTADLRAALSRADAHSIGAEGRAGAVGPPIGDRVRAVLRELIPGQADADVAAIEAERIRLAGDLHAVVLPTLRRAIAEAEAGLPIEDLAARLRSVDLALERLMADRWPVVLDAFGLVAALEDLAERTEADGAVQVVLEIEGSAGRPRPEIERTAWRVAQLAVDNAVRHAAASQIAITVAVAPDRLGLSISDDGRGFDPAGPVRPTARGLVDLGRRASAVGASLEIVPGDPLGTVVRLEWPAPG